jgi:hypothetical protein
MVLGDSDSICGAAPWESVVATTWFARSGPCRVHLVIMRDSHQFLERNFANTAIKPRAARVVAQILDSFGVILSAREQEMDSIHSHDGRQQNHLPGAQS